MMKDLAKGFLVGVAKGFAEGIVESVVGIGALSALGIAIEKIRESKEN